MKILALIPARSGSKGIKDKNIREVCGYPLIAYSILASQIIGVGKIMVSTDSSKIAGIVRDYGVAVPFLRPTEISQDNSLDIEWVIHALDWLEDKEGYIPDLIVHLRPTTPLRRPETIGTAIHMIIASPEATSLRSAHLLEESPQKMFVIKGDFYAPFLNGKGEFYNKPRQEFPNVYWPNGYVDILRPEVIRKGSMHGDKILPFITEKVIEVDSEENLKELELIGYEHIMTKLLALRRPQEI